jgi:hypothetical protein
MNKAMNESVITKTNDEVTAPRELSASEMTAAVGGLLPVLGAIVGSVVPRVAAAAGTAGRAGTVIGGVVRSGLKGKGLADEQNRARANGLEVSSTPQILTAAHR